MADSPVIEKALAAAAQQFEAIDAAMAGYNQPHICDPADVQALFGCVRDELQKPAGEADASVFVSFLVFHRSQIKPSLSAHLMQALSVGYQAANEILRARLMAGADVNSLADALSQAGDIQTACTELETGMECDEARAGVYIAAGDVCLINLSDNAQALEMYEKALEKDAGSVAANQRVFAIADFNGDWNRVFTALDALIAKSHAAERKARYLIRAASIFNDKLKNPNRAVQVFNQALDLCPLYFDVYNRILGIEQSRNDVMGIEMNDIVMIDRIRALENQSIPLAFLYKHIGEIRLGTLHDMSGALEAYRGLSALFPQNVALHEVVARLAETDDAYVDTAIAEYRRILAIVPDEYGFLEDLARSYRRAGKFDESLCTYRALVALGAGSDEAREIVSKFADMGIPRLTEQLPDHLWRYIIPPTLDGAMAQLLKMSTKIIADMFSNDFSTYRINEKSARIDTSADTIFNTTIRNETHALGFAEVPELYRCDRYTGVTNAYFTTRSFLIHPNCLTGRSSHELAFMTAKSLLLMRPEYYLLQLGAQNVELIVRAIFKTIQPALNIELDKNQTQVSKMLVGSLTAEQSAPFAELVRDILNRNAMNAALYMESVEEFANRIGLLFCDDPMVVEGLLAEESRPISSRPVRERVESLMRWAVSEEYFKLRRCLDINLRA